MKKIPFYRNTLSDSHCAQACFRMVLAYFLPHRRFSFKTLDSITGHKEGCWTHPYKMYIWLARNGFQVIHVERFPIVKFAQEGVPFLKEYWTAEFFKQQRQHSNLQDVHKDVVEAIKNKSVNFQYRHGSVFAIRELWKKGYIPIVAVNPFALRGLQGESIHSVVVIGLYKHTVKLHDPGLPPKKSLSVPIDHLRKAMNDNNGLVIGIRKRKAQRSYK